jgi:nucleotide-binding universal stress UspA family protein
MCAVDFSENAALALRVAADLVRRCDARLLIAHVHDPLLVAGAATQGFDLESDTRAEVRKLLKRHVPDQERWSQKPETVITMAPIANGVLELAKTHRADVVVMGTHGLSGYRKAFFGSTTDRVIRRIDIPLIAVPPHMPRRANARLEAGAVLAAVDFSPGSHQAVRLGAAIALTLGVRLELIHVIEQPGVLGRWRRPVAAGEAERAADAEVALRKLADTVSGLRTTIRLERGVAAEAIVKIAKRQKASLIAVGAHGGGQRFARVIGSTAYRVACLSTVPILVVPLRAGRTS